MDFTKQMRYSTVPAVAASGLATAGTELLCSSSHRDLLRKSPALFPLFLGLLQLAVPPLIPLLPELLHAAPCALSYAICVTALVHHCLVKSILAPSPGRRVRLSIAAG